MRWLRLLNKSPWYSQNPADSLREDLDKRLQQLNVLSFDDLIPFWLRHCRVTKARSGF